MIAVGRLKPGPEADLLARYSKRLSPRLDVHEVADARGSFAEVRRRESQALLSALPPSAYVVALDEGGRAYDSLSFSRKLEHWLELPRPLVFLIGGAEGLDADAVARADETLSLGPMTWPHMLVRGLLAEQLYRARAISANHPYHKTGRP
nr:23S rRNA (pseudouridine(1915)-N(3))-methyltransferase RlmH [Ameyamaea chiangmaiensis]